MPARTWRMWIVARPRLLLGMLCGGALLAAVLWWFFGAADSTPVGATFVARRGPLQITVTEGGSIEALQSQVIKSEVPGQTKILTIVEEGYMVTDEDVKNKKVLVTLDNNELLEKQTQQEIQFQSSKATYTESKEQFEIQVKQNESDIKAAELQVKFARMDFQKYLGRELAEKILEEMDPYIQTAILNPAIIVLPAENGNGAEHVGAVPMPEQSGNGSAPVQENPAANSAAPQEASSAAAEAKTPQGAGAGEGASKEKVDSQPASGEQEKKGDAKTDWPSYLPKLPEKKEKASENGQQTASAAEMAPPERVPQENEAHRSEDAATVIVPAVEFGSETIEVERPEIAFDQYAKSELLGDGEAKQQLRKLESELMVAEEDMILAKNQAEGTKRLFEKDFVTKSELQNDEMSVLRKQISQESADTQQQLYIRYEFPKQSEKLLSDYEEALRKLERVKKESVSKLAQAEAKLRSSEAQYQLQLQRRKELREQIDKCTIYAERPGLVVYAGSNEPWRNQEAIKEGATVYEQQEIITIPDMTEMAVTVRIHESSIQKVARNQKATVRVETRPDEVLTGEVVKISVLPDSSRRWYNPDLKVYPITVRLDGRHDWLKPSMSAKAEIEVAQLDDVVYVPIQAVTGEGGERVCYVPTRLGTVDRRVVETAEFNEEFIVVRSGVSEGERVLLRTPATGPESGKKDEPTRSGDREAPAGGASPRPQSPRGRG